jgi:oligopeptide transport system permease protein
MSDKIEKPYAKVIARMRRNVMAMIGLGFIVIALIVSVCGYLIMPDQTPMANEMHLEISIKKPLSQADFIRIPKEQQLKEQSLLTTMWYGRPNADILIPVDSYTLGKDSVTVRLTDGDGQAKTYAYTDLNVPAETAARPGQVIVHKTFVLGTDRYGRDMLSRIILGTRVSLSVGFIAVLISVIAGVTLGALAGFYRGWVDDLISWFINVIWSLPSLLLVIAISFALGKGFWQVFVAIGLSMWVEVARMVRGQILAIREVEYVEAARAMGFSGFRIIYKHILPNIMGPLLVVASANFASAILLEAGLSFLGFGAQPPMPTWGSMVKEHYGYIIIDAAYLAIIPGVAIMMLVFAFNIFSIGLRDAMDMKAGNTNV